MIAQNPTEGGAIRWRIGLDVGSTTVKAVVIDAQSDEIVWKDYQRHDTKQAERTLDYLEAIEDSLGNPGPDAMRIFITGSGGGSLAGHLGAKFVQEVNAVSLAVERLFPDCNSVVELGGQDAKIIIFKEDPKTGRKKKIPSMNDKCAGGTGSVIDKINAKLNIPPDELCEMGYRGIKLHPVAGKCGVFAETDINGLQKQGVPPDQLMASLFEAIIQQNLTVLTRGNTLLPKVLLLGGPNCFIKGMMDCWKVNIPKVWAERNVVLPDGVDPEDLIVVPDDAQYFAAIGAVEFGKEEDPQVGQYKGTEPLRSYLQQGASSGQKRNSSGCGLATDDANLEAFRDKYCPEPFKPARFERGETVQAFLGVDGGSTSTKAVLLSQEREVIVKVYGLSKGNPIEDTKWCLSELRTYVEQQGAELEILGVGTTGYAKDVLRDTLRADAAIVETVAHTESALHFYEDVDVVCDVGGQDIKIICLKNRKVKDFKLNTQCSAGNGYFLQSTAANFGIDVRDYADTAFTAEAYPKFGYGCAVFMQSDIVDFQRQGWAPHEILAGLAAVLPKNIWLYVSQIPNLAKLGSNFVLQGGTQHNLAAVKAQVDFIEERFHDDSGVRPNVFVHKHTGESGAIGAALEAARIYGLGHRTQFIGLDEVARIGYRTTRNESTRCYFCKNKCLRTFIDVSLDGKTAEDDDVDSHAPITPVAELPDTTRRLIIATCDKGEVEDIELMRKIKAGMDEKKKSNPNLVEYAGKRVWRDSKPALVAEPPKRAVLAKARQRRKTAAARKDLRIGFPRVLNMYSVAPFFTAYFQSLGIPFQNFVFSDFTSETLYREGAKRGSIDPCFPSKVGIAHVHNLLYKHHKRKPLDWIVFPMVDALPTFLTNTSGARACPTVTSTPETVKAAFTKEGDLFAELGVRYLDTFVNFAENDLLQRQMFEEYEELLGLTHQENERATAEGLKALNGFDADLRVQGREILGTLEQEQRLGIVVLGRPYHNDPGINHEILEELQREGYPILTIDSLPTDADIVEPLFREDVEAGLIEDGLDISDVWKNSYSENTSRKVWAAKFVARHPWLVGLELSSFKCGHDAPIYTVVEEIVENSGTPFFAFKDIDENRPSGSIKIRVETISYFLTRYLQDLLVERDKRGEIERQLEEFEARLRRETSEAVSVA
ncbi:MAG: acyl-CoA dehydratase activase-related protein [Planctomycetota bacterium]|nr:acyl-CoA dehydratase activase-related protein [Planctomycetota bacterium]